MCAAKKARASNEAGAARDARASAVGSLLQMPISFADALCSARRNASNASASSSF